VQTLTADILSPVLCLAVSHDRTRLFCGHSDGSVVMWDMGTKKGIQVSTFQDFDTCITFVLVSHDDSAIISVSSIHLIRRDLYKLDRDAVHFQKHFHGVHPSQSAVLSADYHPFRSAFFSADSRLVYCCSESKLVIWNAITGQLLKVTTSHFLCMARVGVFNKLMACCAYGQDGSCLEFRLLELNLQEIDSHTCTLNDIDDSYHDDDAYSICLSDDGKRVICGLKSGQVFVGHFHESQRDQRLYHKFHDQFFQTMQIREPRRESVYLRKLRKCHFWNEGFYHPVGVAISGDGAFCASGNPGNTVAVWDLNKMLKFDLEAHVNFNYPPRFKFEGHTDKVLAVLFF
jgi:WD40 repeat protein